MSEFDPYLKWLGIREASRPVNHYRLLGLELFESDKDVISMAADRQMAHIRTYQSGPNGKISQKILNELARARRCLLVEEKKAAYDQKLRASLAAATEIVGATAVETPEIVPVQVVDPPVAQPIVDDSDQGFAEPSFPQSSAGATKLNVRTDPNARAKTKSREKKQLMLSLLGWVSGGLAALGVGAFLLGTGILGPGGNSGGDPAGGNGKGGENGKLVTIVGPDKVDPNNVDPSKVEPSKVEPIEVEPSKVEPSKVEPSKVDPNKRKPSKPKSTNSLLTTKATVTPNFEMPVVWTVKTLDSYPKPSNDEQVLLMGLISNFNSKRLKKLGSSAPTTAGTSGVKQEILGLSKPSLLIGMTYTVDQDLKIKTLQPVFRTRDSLLSNASSRSRLVIAKPGYAVAEVQASILNPMNCFRVKFMKVTQRGLRASDSYYSSWLGREVGPVRTIENPTNAPIVGVYCDLTSNRQIQTLGLIGSDRSMTPTRIEPEVAAAAPVAAANTVEPEENIIGKSLPVISRNPVASSFFRSGAPKEQIVFVNKTDESVRVYAVDENLKERYYFQVRPGSTRSFPTLVGAIWHVKKENLGIATYKAELGQNTAIIDDRAPDIAGTGVLPTLEGLEKQAIPSSTARNTAMKEAKKVYGDLISKSNAGDAQSNRKNAQGIIDDARDSKDEAMQYVMFQTAKEIAVATGDCGTAMLALRELERRFEEFEFWDEAVGAVEDSGRSLGRTGDKSMARELELVLRSLIDEAVQSGESRSAHKLAMFGLKAASRNGDARAVRFYKSKDSEVDEVAKLQKQYESAVVKLAADPKNSLANIQKGRYLIVTQQNYEAALECWKLSGEEEYLDIVKDESSPNANASFLARRWQNLGEDADTLFGRRCYERAIEVLKAAGKNREASDLRKNLEK